MSKTLTIMNYASQTLTGGPQTGLAPRLAPGAGLLQQGFYQGRRVPGRMLSWILGTLDDNNYVAAHKAMKEWSSFAIPSVGTDSYVSVVGMKLIRAYGTLAPNDSQRQVIVLGRDTAASSKVRLCHAGDGSAPEPTPNLLSALAFTAPVWAVSGAAGELAIVNNTAAFAYTSTSTNTWTSFGGFSGAPSVIALHYDSTLGYFAIAQITCYKGTSFAFGSPTTGAIPTPASSGFASNEVEMASNGTALVVAGTTVAGAAALYRSTDAGATWTSVLSFAGAAHCNVTYSEYYSLFVAWSDAGVMYTSGDGAAWTSIATGRTPANGFVAGRGSLVTVGPVIAKPTQLLTAYGAVAGIAYSLDLGVSWNYHYFNDNDTLLPSPLRAFNGRIYAVGPNRLWRSGLLTAPSAEAIP